MHLYQWNHGCTIDSQVTTIGCVFFIYRFLMCPSCNTSNAWSPKIIIKYMHSYKKVVIKAGIERTGIKGRRAYIN